MNCKVVCIAIPYHVSPSPTAAAWRKPRCAKGSNPFTILSDARHGTFIADTETFASDSASYYQFQRAKRKPEADRSSLF
jgi:hypothetical protein